MTVTLRREVDENFSRFSSDWRKELAASAVELAPSAKYRDSYRSLASLEAWRALLLERLLSPGSLGFYVEAQNDAIVSHVLAASGMWRPSLQVLRSFVENFCASLYFMDHPVELRLWQKGLFQTRPTALLQYLQSHPDIGPTSASVNGLPILIDEYGTLSRAVHASSAGFRMSSSGTVKLSVPAVERLGMWHSREKRVLGAANLLMLALFRVHVQGTRLPGLRQSVGLALGKSVLAKVRVQLGVRIPLQ